jgi:hypothetical protein
MFTCLTIVLVKIHTKGYWDLTGAIGEIVDEKWAAFVVLFISVMLTAMITQAFSFECIQFLEGHWGTSGLMQSATSHMTRVQLRRRRRLQRKYEHLTLKAFLATKPRLVGSVNSQVLTIVEELLRDAHHDVTHHSKRRVRQARRLLWSPDAPAHIVRNLEHVAAKARIYGSPQSTLPTQLGNVLRHYELQLDVEDEDIQGYVISRLGAISPQLLKQHDEYRTKLDLYSVMVFIFGILAIMSVAMLIPGFHNKTPGSITAASFCLLSLLSYKAAIASAHGLGVVHPLHPAGEDPVRPDR